MQPKVSAKLLRASERVVRSCSCGGRYSCSQWACFQVARRNFSFFFAFGLIIEMGAYIIEGSFGIDLPFDLTRIMNLFANLFVFHPPAHKSY